MKPMLATDYDAAKLRLPAYASPKLDGIRGLVQGGTLLSRSLKPIPNKHIQSILGDEILNGFDGELIVGEPTSSTCYTDSVSFVMARDKVGPFNFYVFDLHDMPEHGYEDRLLSLKTISDDQRLATLHHPDVRVHILEQRLIKTLDDLAEYEAHCVDAGYEGLILRKIDGVYKFGRSTVNEGLLLKVKRFVDGEATVIGFQEQMENTNEKTTNELGRSKRSSHKAGLVGKGTLGALLLRDLESGVEFSCGTGMDDRTRQWIWDHRSEVQDMIWKYKSFPVGVKTLPRHPVSIGPRSPLDM